MPERNWPSSSTELRTSAVEIERIVETSASAKYDQYLSRAGSSCSDLQHADAPYSHLAGGEPDCVAEDAVSCELVSAPNSLFAESGHPSRFSSVINACTQWLTAEFPTQRNREFTNAYQGIFFEEQGIFSIEEGIQIAKV